MAIMITCESCNTRLKVADQHAGRKIRCPKCGEVMSVPSEQVQVSPSPTGRTRQAEVDDEEDVEDRRRTKARRSKRDDDDEQEPLSHAEKVAYMIKDLKSRGVSPGTSAPPVFRLLWAMGLKVPPPLFMGFLTTLLALAIPAGAAWGVGMWFMQWQGMNMSPLMAVAGGAAFGLLFGLAMAFVLRSKAKKLGLGSWKDYPGRGRMED